MAADVVHEVTPAQLVEAVAGAGGLVGVNAAARILNVAPPNFKRYRPRLTEVEVEGSASVFVRPEVEALAAELEAARASRASD
jgi:hypothetical protein